VFISPAYAADAGAAAGGFGGLSQFLPFVLMFVVIYFVMIRPQMKRQKEIKAMLDALAKGDEVVVAGGILGRVTKLGESIVHVEVASQVELQVQRQAIAQVLPKGSLK
jgi:preprotein translocase subunit YajC